MTPPPAPVPPTVSPTASPVSSQSAASPAAASQTLHPATQPLAVVAEKLPWRQTFNSLSIPNFRIFTAGHFVAVIAVWMQRIAQDWLVLQLSGSVTAVGVTAALQFLPSLVDSGEVLRELFGQAEELEIVGLEVHTRKDSPQPQRSRSLGLLNLKPSFRPSRTKSSCVPSI